MIRHARRIEERRSFKRIVDRGLTSTKNGVNQEVKQESYPDEDLETMYGTTKYIYHTHWVVLLNKVIFSSMLLLSFLLLIFFLTANEISIMDNPPGFISFGLVFIGLFFWWTYQYLDWRNDQYQITNDQIIDIYRKPFGTEDRRTASISNIQSIRYERKGILGLMLNYGTVYIRVGNEEFTFDNVPDPAGIQENLFGVLEMSMARIKKTELTEQQQNLAEWMETYYHIREEQKRD